MKKTLEAQVMESVLTSSSHVFTILSCLKDLDDISLFVSMTCL